MMANCGSSTPEMMRDARPRACAGFPPPVSAAVSNSSCRAGSDRRCGPSRPRCGRRGTAPYRPARCFGPIERRDLPGRRRLAGHHCRSPDSRAYRSRRCAAACCRRPRQIDDDTLALDLDLARDRGDVVGQYLVVGLVGDEVGDVIGGGDRNGPQQQQRRQHPVENLAEQGIRRIGVARSLTLRHGRHAGFRHHRVRHPGLPRSGNTGNHRCHGFPATPVQAPVCAMRCACCAASIASSLMRGAFHQVNCK